MRGNRENGCVGRDCQFSGPGEDSFPTGQNRSERGDSTDPYQSPDREWMAREVLKEVLWEMQDCGEAMDHAKDLGECEQPAPPPVRRHQAQPREGGRKQSSKDSHPSKDWLKAARSRLCECACSPVRLHICLNVRFICIENRENKIH